MDIKIDRDVVSKEWYVNYKTRILFIHLLLTADTETARISTSIRALATSAGLTVQATRTAIKHLQELGKIEVCASNQCTTITILDYEQYLDKKAAVSEKKTKAKPKNPKSKEKLDLESLIKELPEESQDAVRDYVSMRARIKRPIATENTLIRAIKKAKKFAGDDTEKFTRIFEQSVDHSWQGVYDLKEDAPREKAASIWDA